MGISAEGLGRDHWNEMLAYPRKPIAHWHSLVEVKKSFREVGEVTLGPWHVCCMAAWAGEWQLAAARPRLCGSLGGTGGGRYTLLTQGVTGRKEMGEDGGKLLDKKPLMLSILKVTLSSKQKRKTWRKPSQQLTVPGPECFHEAPEPSQSFQREPQEGEIRTWQEILPLSKQ